jgi:hypothetical protein
LKDTSGLLNVKKVVVSVIFTAWARARIAKVARNLNRKRGMFSTLAPYFLST